MMSLKSYTILTFVIGALVFFEYFALNFRHDLSFLHYLMARGFIDPNTNLSTEAGHPVSYWLGWGGGVPLFITLIYVFRKRIRWFKSWGNLSGWLDFHIFMGLVGPVLIVAHSDFKVGGLVAIAFWSMMISSISGIFGRYLYLQTAQEKNSLLKRLKKWDAKIEKYRVGARREVAPEKIKKLKIAALRHAGAPTRTEALSPISIFSIPLKSFMGDFRLLFGYPKGHRDMTKKTRMALANYAIATRKIATLNVYEQLLGYWHAFHLPFAIFMYITALIHIVTALLFGVNA